MLLCFGLCFGLSGQKVREAVFFGRAKEYTTTGRGYGAFSTSIIGCQLNSLE
jgi:hypothetical protein